MFAAEGLLLPIGADAVCAAGSGGRVQFAVFFDGVDHLHTGRYSLSAEDFAHTACHAAVAGDRDIVHLDLGRIELVGGPHAGDDRDVPFTAGRDQRCLGGEVVNGVQQVVRLPPQQFSGIVPGKEGLDRNDFSCRIDVPQAGGHDLDLGLADSAGEGVDLAVDVGQADIVEIHQRDSAEAGPPQCFGGVAADSADTADHDVFTGQRGESGFADQEFGAREAVHGHACTFW